MSSAKLRQRQRNDYDFFQEHRSRWYALLRLQRFYSLLIFGRSDNDMYSKRHRKLLKKGQQLISVIRPYE